jgi:hypothetical protein
VQKNWEMVFTPEARGWYDRLPQSERDGVTAALDHLGEHGPALRGKLVKLIKTSRYDHMKELRPPVRNIRVLFAFDKQQRAVILVGGDKTNDWSGWYRRNVKTADRLFDQHQQRMRGGGTWQLNRTGSRSEPRAR